MSVKRYTAAGSGVMRTDPKGEYVHYSDYIDLKSQPDALTAYLYAAELGKDNVKTLKIEINRLRQENLRLAREAGYVEMTYIVTKEEAEKISKRLELYKDENNE